MILNYFSIFFCLILSAFFSGFETALLGLNPFNIVKGTGTRLDWLLQKREVLISATLLGNNVSIVTAAILFHKAMGAHEGVLINGIAFTLEIVLFFILAEVLPKSIARKTDLRLLNSGYYFFRMFYFLFYIPASIFMNIADLANRFLAKKDLMEKGQIFHFLANHLYKKENNITEQLMLLATTTVKEIMTPTSKIYSLERQASVKEALNLLKETNYSRFPIYKKRGDNLVGYITISDLLKAGRNSKVIQLMHPGVYVPDSLNVDLALFKMQAENLPILFVVNEFGSVIGMLTYEDIAEELVGDILFKEQSNKKELIVHVNLGEFLLEADLDIDDFNSYFKLNIKKHGFETIGGYLQNEMDCIPEVGMSLKNEFGQFKVLAVDQKTTHQINFQIK